MVVKSSACDSDPEDRFGEGILSAAFAERMVRTFREELFDRILVFNEQDRRRTVEGYVQYYNERRVQSTIGPDSPCRRYELPRLKGVDLSVRPREVLGGVITDFEMEAA